MDDVIDSTYSFKGGYPTPETAQQAYDDSDLIGAIEAYKFFDRSWKPGDFETVQ